MHAAAGFPVKSAWLKEIKNGNFESWPGLTYNNAAKYLPHSVETLKGHMVKYSQGVISTKKNKYQANNNQKKPIQGTLQKNLKQRIFHHRKKTKNSTYGINPSVNYILIIVADSRSDLEVEMNT